MCQIRASIITVNRLLEKARVGGSRGEFLYMLIKDAYYTSKRRVWIKGRTLKLKNKFEP